MEFWLTDGLGRIKIEKERRTKPSVSPCGGEYIERIGFAQKVYDYQRVDLP